ncbi:MAG: Type 1 glutamine amidotransferase-like domain-containing protein [Candidatus Pacebacteria bacterium]|nr:Type 1 glutamine amidotransferase-like domain-containing protein [Candidatus Paceibacterota bacterium]
MKLYLTSNGLEDNNVAEYFRKTVLSKDIKAVSFLVVSVKDSEFYIQKTINQLKVIGAVDIDIFELKDKKFDTIKKYDVVYVCGGNTFVYLDRIKKTGLDKFIINSVRSNRSIYMGVSAGSIVAGHNIELAGWGDSGDVNEIGLIDLKGLGLIDMLVFPHYLVQEEKMLKEFEKKNKCQITRLSDNQAVFINNDIVSIID